MNQLSIAFICCLSEHSGEEDILKGRVQKELLKEVHKRLPAFVDPQTIYLSPRGAEFAAKLSQLLDDIRRMAAIDATSKLFRRLKKLCEEADALRKEARIAWQNPGKLDPERLHMVFAEEKAAAEERLYAAVSLEMFRLVAAGGGRRFADLPRLQYVHPTVEDYYQYYAKHIIPALDIMERSKRFGLWAFQFKEQAHTGGMSRIPVYVQAPIKPDKTPLLPGEYRVYGSGANTIWQGLGAITNLTPDLMTRAQSEGIECNFRPEHLRKTSLNGTPAQILDQCFAGRLYAIDPVQFFSVLTIVRSARTLILRVNNNQCMYCGADGANGSLCLSCLGKVKQKYDAV
ncbi:MAG: hypothetical protein IKK75_09195 [Clostridia bacterium]|nr:hypothetical protein [Clostridia bacterium]